MGVRGLCHRKQQDPLLLPRPLPEHHGDNMSVPVAVPTAGAGVSWLVHQAWGSTSLKQEISKPAVCPGEMIKGEKRQGFITSCTQGVSREVCWADSQTLVEVQGVTGKKS